VTTDTATMDGARAVVPEAIHRYLLDPNVMLIDIGFPERGGEMREAEVALRVHVRKKLLPAQLEAADTRPVTRTIDGFPTDVLEGIYRPHLWWGWSPGLWGQVTRNPRAVRANPMRGGISISEEHRVAYGTLGGAVLDRMTGQRMILSCWHVLAGDWVSRPRRIYQPGRLDGGGSADTVALLTRDAMSVNLDAAVATLNGSRPLVNEQMDLGPVSGVRRAELGLTVEKSGRRTGITSGRVTGVEGTATITYGYVTRVIREVLTIDPFWASQVSAPGDSGAWWLSRGTGEAVGLHFAGSDVPERALALQMVRVLAALSVTVDIGAPETLRSAVYRPRPVVRPMVGAGRV
jgi:hypothetical protein